MKVVMIPEERIPDIALVSPEEAERIVGYGPAQAHEVPDDLYHRYVAARTEYDAVQQLLDRLNDQLYTQLRDVHTGQ